MHSQTKAKLDRYHCIYTIKSEIKYINFYHCSVNLNFFDKKVSQNGIQSLHFKILCKVDQYQLYKYLLPLTY